MDHLLIDPLDQEDSVYFSQKELWYSQQSYVARIGTSFYDTYPIVGTSV